MALKNGKICRSYLIFLGIFFLLIYLFCFSLFYFILFYHNSAISSLYLDIPYFVASHG